jgi:NadR type nicotinamide-nucleotide adenylyltransferase
LDLAQAESDEVVVIVLPVPGDVTMRSSLRAGWITQMNPNIRVLVPEDAPPDDRPESERISHLAAYVERIGLQVDTVFGADEESSHLAPLLSSADHHVTYRGLARDAQLVTVSIDQIRADVHRYRHLLPPSVYAHFVEMVVFLGAESTGKSTLAEALAFDLDTLFVPEYGREVWERKNRQLTLDDYVHIAAHHLEIEDELRQQANRFLFVDTNPLTTMLLCYAFEGDGLPELTELARRAEHRYRHVVLCANDIPFTQDGWRENERWRTRVQGMVRFDLAVRGIPYMEVRGSVEARVRQVKSALALGHSSSSTASSKVGRR